MQCCILGTVPLQLDRFLLIPFHSTFKFGCQIYQEGIANVQQVDSPQTKMCCNACVLPPVQLLSLVPRLLPRKMGREPVRTDHVHP